MHMLVDCSGWTVSVTLGHFYVSCINLSFALFIEVNYLLCCSTT
jgi:hypothetical protein